MENERPRRSSASSRGSGGSRGSGNRFYYSESLGSHEVEQCAVNFSTIVNASVGNTGTWNQMQDVSVDTRVERTALAECTVEDFSAYLDTFRDEWQEYRRFHRPLPKSDNYDVDTESLYKIVPPMYFSPDFSLEQHEVFHQPFADTIRDQDTIQSNLTKYLDLVDTRLFEQIESAHEERVFLNMLPDFKEIQAYVARAKETTKEYREVLANLKRDRLDAAFRAVSLSRKRDQIREVLRRLELIKTVSQAPVSVELLLETGDFLTALDLIEHSSSVLGEDGPLHGVNSDRAGREI